MVAGDRLTKEKIKGIYLIKFQHEEKGYSYITRNELFVVSPQHHKARRTPNQTVGIARRTTS